MKRWGGDPGLKKNYPQPGLNLMCGDVCVFSFWLVSVHKDVSFLHGFAFLMSFQLLYNEIFQWAKWVGNPSLAEDSVSPRKFQKMPTHYNLAWLLTLPQLNFLSLGKSCRHYNLAYVINATDTYIRIYPRTSISFDLYVNQFSFYSLPFNHIELVLLFGFFVLTLTRK